MSSPQIFPLPDLTITGCRPKQVDLCDEAAQLGDLKRVKQLVYEALDEDHLTDRGWFAGSVASAIERNDLAIVKFLLSENIATPTDRYLIELAIRCQTYDILELLLELGWDLNTPVLRNMPPPLWIPLCDGQKQMVEWLLDHGADPNARCAWDFTPASQAMLCAPLDIIDHILDRGVDIGRGELLQWAVIRQKPDVLDVVQRLVDRGAPINKLKYEDDPASFDERMPFGLGTPRHRAAECGKADVVHYLLEHGADPLKLDSKGKTPRYWADQNGYPAVGIQLIHAEDDWFPRLKKKDSSLEMQGFLMTAPDSNGVIYR